MVSKNIKRLLGTFGAGVVLAFASIAGAGATPPSVDCPSGSHQQGENCKVTICHRTDSVTNPYTKNDVDLSSVDGNGSNDNGKGDHLLDHTGPIADTQATAQSLKDNDQKWGDIIPPVTGVEAGLNWTATGQAMLANDCNFVTGGQGGGNGGGTNNGGQVLGATTTQVTQTPAGGVGAGEGGGASAYSPVSIIGVSGSLVTVLAALRWATRRSMLGLK